MDLLGRAKKVWKGLGPPEPPAPQFYRVSCPEGHVLRGQRTEGYQALRCPGCGEGVFILPRSPLPAPPAPAARKKKAPALDPAAVDEGPVPLTDAPPGTHLAPADLPDVEIPWEEEIAEAESGEHAQTFTPPELEPKPESRPEPSRPPEREGEGEAERPSPKRRRRVSPAAAPEVKQVEPAPPSGPPPGMILVPKRQAVSRFRQHRRMLLVLAVLGVVALTVVGQIRRRYRENLPQIAAENREEGTSALESGTFDVAKAKLRIAADALRSLNDPEAAEAEQLAREAAILADLVSTPLEVLVERVATQGGPDAFQVHQGRSVIFHAPVAEGGRELDYRIIAGTRRGRVDLDGFHLLDGKKPGEPVTFGARLKAIRLGDNGTWHILLEPDSGVYISTPSAWKALATMDWPIDYDPATVPAANAKAEPAP